MCRVCARSISSLSRLFDTEVRVAVNAVRASAVVCWSVSFRFRFWLRSGCGSVVGSFVDVVAAVVMAVAVVESSGDVGVCCWFVVVAGGMFNSISCTYFQYGCSSTPLLLFPSFFFFFSLLRIRRMNNTVKIEIGYMYTL